MAAVALVLAVPALAAPAHASLAAWAASRGVPVAEGSSALVAAVGAFAAGHAAVLIAHMEAPDAVLDLAARELGAPLTAVVGLAPGGRLAFVGATELVPGLLALRETDVAAEAVRLADEAGLSVVVVEQE